MKTKEFIKRVKGLGFKVADGYFAIHVSTNGINSVANVDKEKEFSIKTCTGAFRELRKEQRKQLLELCVEYASTPVEDREEEKKFYLRHKYLRFVDISAEYFTICTSQKFPFLEDKAFSDGYEQQFTLKEIEELKEKFDTDLADFELVEVKE